MFNSVINGSVTIESLLMCTLASLILGNIFAAVYAKTTECSKNFAVSLAIMPMLVEIVIMMVNGNIGAGVAVMGAFSLIRFRSQPGNSKEITAVFFTMAIGLATGMGYIGYAVVFAAIAGTVFFILSVSHFAEDDTSIRELKITIPEDQDYEEIYDDIFEKYLVKHDFTQVKTANMGSLFELTYNVKVKTPGTEKKMIDEIRTRNGNLTVMLRRPKKDEMEL